MEGLDDRVTKEPTPDPLGERPQSRELEEDVGDLQHLAGVDRVDPRDKAVGRGDVLVKIGVERQARSIDSSPFVP